ncbi:MAG: orotidine-5'-phosphate decarboxylase [Mariprofundaceae bacterium]|nr:orotidine-5'-phosphate decarboxylase [Mariprofundaceae bacterium]
MMRDRLMVALDMPDREQALSIRQRIGDSVGWFKVGLRLFVAEGPSLIRTIVQNHRVFLDLKFHDIPNTVAEAVTSAGNLGVHMTNIHAEGGLEMMRAAAQSAAAFPQMKIIAVTVLTSSPIQPDQARHEAVHKATLARDAGLDGVVCSVHEVANIKKACGADFLTVTPGIRWGDQPQNDQKRVADPEMAIRQGADYIVVGRPIIQASDPGAAALEALSMMQRASS